MPQDRSALPRQSLRLSLGEDKETDSQMPRIPGSRASKMPTSPCGGIPTPEPGPRGCAAFHLAPRPRLGVRPSRRISGRTRPVLHGGLRSKAVQRPDTRPPTQASPCGSREPSPRPGSAQCSGLSSRRAVATKGMGLAVTHPVWSDTGPPIQRVQKRTRRGGGWGVRRPGTLSPARTRPPQRVLQGRVMLTSTHTLGRPSPSDSKWRPQGKQMAAVGK